MSSPAGQHDDKRLCSIILPCYNRARFLPEAFAAIAAQTHRDWELIVVDDGSTDDTAAVVEQLIPTMPGPVRLVRQANAGAPAARNAGLDHATGAFIAFYDSDDLWLPDHLAACIQAMSASPDVHWVYASCRSVDMDRGDRVIEADVFRPGGRPLAFLGLHTSKRGDLNVIDDQRVVCFAIYAGLYSGLQASVFRRSVFAGLRLPPFRLGDDQIIIVQALKRGYRPAYFDRVHVVYRVHGQNLSNASVGSAAEKRAASTRQVIAAFEALPGLVTLAPDELHAWRRRLAQEYFWKLGYALLACDVPASHVLDAMRHGLRHTPGDLRMRKSLVATRVKLALGLAGRRRAPQETR